MSVNRENAIWASPEGGYKMGLYDFYYVNQDSEDFDPEWNVEYNFDVFTQVLTGTSVEDCIAKYCRSNANAGAYNIYENTPENANSIARFEKMYKELKESADHPTKWTRIYY
jgi:hypothetical protein